MFGSLRSTARSRRTKRITCARAGLPCSPAMTFRPPAPGRANRSRAGNRPCGGTASSCRSWTARSLCRSARAGRRSSTRSGLAGHLAWISCTSRTSHSIRRTPSRPAAFPPRSRARIISAPKRSRFRPREMRATRWPPTPRAPASKHTSSCRVTSRRRSFASASCTTRTSLSSMASSLMRAGWQRNWARRTAGTTSRRSRSRTASRARRRWGTSWRSSSTGRCPTGSSIPRAEAPAWSACGRPSRKCRRWAGSTGHSGRTW